jgi:tetratricopeptide (TPR) repeat protein
MQTDIQEMRKEIEEMQLELEKKQRRLETKKAKCEENPDDEDCREDYNYIKKDVERLINNLQPKLNKYNKLKEDFAKHQELLFNTAKRVTKLQGEEINDRIRRAIDALNDGLVREANTILNEAEEDAKNLLNEYKQSKEITEQKRRNLVISIKELSLKNTSIMADASIPIDERIKQAEEIYELADTIAQEINYDQEKYIDFLWDYSTFLNYNAHYDKALEVYSRLIKLCEESYGKEHPNTAWLYNQIAWTYHLMGKYEEALPWAEKAVDASPQNPGIIDTLATVYQGLGRYNEALVQFELCLKLKKEQDATEESIHETEAKIAELKNLMKTNS